MSNFLWYSVFHIGSILTVLLTLLFSSKILRSTNMPSVTMVWLLIILFVPLLGIPLYLAFGERKLGVRLNEKAKLALRASKKQTNYRTTNPIHSLLTSLGLPASSPNNQSQFHKDGKASWHDLVDLLENAKEYLDIAIFILGNDSVGQHVLSILERKASDGVKIRLLLDGVGSFTLSKKRFKKFINNGGELAWFIPVIHRPFRGRTNLRNHRKIVIADNKLVWAGGRNISGDYLDPDCLNSCWVDMSFVQKGPVVPHYLAIFEADWAFATHNKTIPSYTIEQPLSSTITGKNTSELQLIPSGPDVEGDPIYSVILTACYASKSHIMITTPYYIPDDNIQKALKLAALRGVTVDLLIPEKSNHKFADIARNRAVRELVHSGVNVWCLPVMIHAKIMIIDTDFAMAGSANLDIRSLFLNCELMSAFYSEQDIAWLSQWFVSLRQTSKRYEAQKVSAVTELIEGLVLLGAFQL